MPPEINENKCNGCGICLFQCGGVCFLFDPVRYKAYLKYGNRCVDCLICEYECPQEAITVRFRRAS